MYPLLYQLWGPFVAILSQLAGVVNVSEKIKNHRQQIMPPVGNEGLCTMLFGFPKAVTFLNQPAAEKGDANTQNHREQYISGIMYIQI